MAGMKKGLGRGLDALLEPYAGPEADRDAANRVLEISVRDIDTNRAQPRKSFDEAALRELADSIRVHGVVQPLLVRPNGSRYTIVAGERRFRAARLAGLETVPVLAAEYDEAQMQEVALIENLQREELNPVEEAAAIRFLMQQHDLTQEEVSERLGKSRPAIANALRLLNLDRNVLELVRTGALSAGHGRALAAVTDAATQERLADECVRLGYSVRALESRVRNLQAGRKPSKKAAPAPHSGDLAQAERALRDRLGTRVRIAGDERRGRITIEYYSADDLQRIYERIVDE